jgi:acetolactate synthase-1/2/3 large subunit
MTGAEALLRALRAMGVECIFASPGSDWAPLWEALAAAPEGGSTLATPNAAAEFPAYISSRHEDTALGMAMGYAKATGKLPAVVLHTTVGALHGAMLMRAALHERIPMVVLAGESIGFSEEKTKVGRQWLRLLTDTGGPARLMESCVKWSFGLNTPAILPQSVQRACQLAVAAPRGPVFLSVPVEHLVQEMPKAPPPASLPLPAVASDSTLRAIADALNGARNPVIVTEEAGRDPRAVDELVALAEKLGAPVFEAWQPYYANFPRGHPLCGGLAYDDMPEMLKDADAVFLVESILPWHPPSSITDKKVLVLAEDPLRSNLPFWGFRADVIASGDVAASLAQLLPLLKTGARDNGWRAKLAARREAFLKAGKEAGARPVIETAWVGHELNAVLPADAVIVNETISHRLALHQQLERLGKGSHFEASFGGLGVGLALGLGVKFAQPKRTVVVTIGDGAFHYNPVVGSFGAAQELGLPLFVVLFNNAGYQSQKNDVGNYYPQGNAVKSGQAIGTRITPPPDYTLLARAYGGIGEVVEKPGEVRAALQRGIAAAQQGQLALLDVRLKPV